MAESSRGMAGLQKVLKLNGSLADGSEFASESETANLTGKHGVTHAFERGFSARQGKSGIVAGVDSVRRTDDGFTGQSAAW
jgi:hypothetical protein